MHYLLSNRPSQNTYFDRLSTLCKQYNEKKNNQVRNTSSAHCRSPNRAPKGTSDTHSHSANRTAARKIISSYNPMISSPTLQSRQTIEALVKHIIEKQHREQLPNLLIQFSSVFDNSHHNILNLRIENAFNTVHHVPPAFRPRRNPHPFQETRRLFDEFLEAGILQESNSPYAAPGFIVPRKDDRLGRLVIDYRALNQIKIPDANPSLHGEDLLQDLGRGYHYLSKLDFEFGYRQLLIPFVDCPKTTFVVSQGHDEFLVLSMGAENAPAGFQKMMCHLFNPCLEF
jgi:hypothetical protein